MKEKIIVTGASGLVGSKFVEKAKTHFEIISPEYPEFDLTDIDSVYQHVLKANPDWIINFAAFTDVNSAENQKGDQDGIVWKTNVTGLENLCNSFLSDKIIQISTDMVFSGTKENPGPYHENSSTESDQNRLTWYGWTKNQAEKIIHHHGGSVLRITYPVRSNFPPKLDYIRSYVKKFQEGKQNPLFKDQHVSISFIDEVAEALINIVENDASGIFHVSSDSTTPYELLSFVIDQLGGDTSKVTSSSIVDFLKTQPNQFRYPQFGGLNSNQTENELGMHFSTWQTVVEKLIAQGLSLD